MRAGVRSLDDVPARLLFDLFYCLVLDETRERVDRREELDAQLASSGAGITRPLPTRADRAQRAASWGKTPAHQRAMRNAINAGGSAANVAGKRRRARG